MEHPISISFRKIPTGINPPLKFNSRPAFPQIRWGDQDKELFPDSFCRVLLMDLFSQSGRWLIIMGISMAVVGAMIVLLGKFGGMKEFPGTIQFEGNGVSCVLPLLGSIVVSILLTLVLNIILRIFYR
jgi:hypothetical protein